jgi:hypothetical protein
MENIFGKMKEAELAIGSYYKACSEKDSPENMDFWSALSGAESRHAGYLVKILLLINKSPNHYIYGLDFDPVNISELISQVRASTARVKSLKMAGKDLLLAARDMEDRLLENKYFDSVKSEEKEFVDFLNTMKEETVQHREMIIKKLGTEK